MAEQPNYDDLDDSVESIKLLTDRLNHLLDQRDWRRAAKRHPAAHRPTGTEPEPLAVVLPFRRATG